jgi:chemotaxis protein methyltransferase CheR
MSQPQSVLSGSSGQRSQSISDAAFETLARRMRDDTGIVLSHAKKGLAVSRLSRRLRVLGLPDFESYCEVLRGPDGVSEMQEMILLLTTNVTRFFREHHHFEALKADVLPDLVKSAKAGGRVRIWSAGCSSGEEAYSLAMTLLDIFPQAPSCDIRVLATDIDRNVLDMGRRGSYRLSGEDVAAYPTLTKHMSKDGDDPAAYNVSSALKTMVQFGELNLQQSWPMKGKFDVIFCRNVVIYFSNETQQALWPRFAEALNLGGRLLIGHSERVSGPATATLKSCGVTQYQRQS